MASSVAIFGGGVGGLSAAHELVERGFSVTVYESKAWTGGKARTIYVPGTGRDGREGLPGEHGFRFFPSFYRHLPDTMSRIPFPGKQSVAENLVATHRTLIAREDPPEEVPVIAHFPRSPRDLRTLQKMLASRLHVPWSDLFFFYRRTMELLTTCDERRLAELEKLPWWEFIEAERRSKNYRKYFGEIAVRFLVAMAPHLASTRTVGSIGLQLTLGHFDPFSSVDRVLNGPTHEAWIRPWLEYLKGRGVRFEMETPAVGIHMNRDRIHAVRVRRPGGGETQITADHYVMAVPVERMVPLVTAELSAVDPALGRLSELRTDCMNGIQFFLRRDVPLSSGHIVFSDAPWALTAISQAQFWPGVDLSKYGDGTVRGILSIVISHWHEKGDYSGRCAIESTAEQIKDEVWAEVKAHLNDMGETLISDEDLVGWYLADSVRFEGGAAINDEPLLINVVDSWKNRPEAVTRIPNLFLAADYVRTHTDLATMEAANEAARRAVNGILASSGVRAAPCKIWPLEDPAVFAPAKWLDAWRFRRGKPNLLSER